MAMDSGRPSTVPINTIDPYYEGKRIIVTGGTKGIGAAIVARLSAAGARVVPAARNTPATITHPERFVRADLSTAAGIQLLAERALELFGGVDIVVHNVGGMVAPPGGALTLSAPPLPRTARVWPPSSPRLASGSRPSRPAPPIRSPTTG